MEIKNSLIDGQLTMKLEGRLDTVAAPELEKAFNESPDDIDELILDFRNLEYISSAGLRVLLLMISVMEKKGEIKAINVPEHIMDVFEITEVDDLLTIE